MTDNPRFDRIQRLLHELRYEITRGMMENEIEEELFYSFVVQRSRHIPDGIVMAEFRCRPAPTAAAYLCKPTLELVKGGEK